VSLKTQKKHNMNNIGITYNMTGESRRGRVSRYHQKPNANFLNKSSHKIDVSGLKKIDQKNTILFDGNEYESKFTIGFEVEKSQLSRGAVREYELFCGFETDSSCGYEAVTHVLPLLPQGQWRTKVYDMMHKAERIIDDRHSPSDKKCGGHITVAAGGIGGVELNELLRKNCGIIHALFRHRLKNIYCGSNRRMQNRADDNFNSATGGCYGSTACHWKYQTVLVKGNCVEFRVPSKFESVKQMMRRYELFYELINFSVNKPNGTFKSFLKIIKPIVISMYNGDEDKANEILALAASFQVFINAGTIADDIEKFLN